MLNKPEILKGEEVKEINFFINKEFLFNLDGNELDLYLKDLCNINDFYSQPFLPEMITEYFIETDVRTDLIAVNNFDNFYGNRIFSPKTLNQFITNCIQADIKLIWK